MKLPYLDLTGSTDTSQGLTLNTSSIKTPSVNSSVNLTATELALQFGTYTSSGSFGKGSGEKATYFNAGQPKKDQTAVDVNQFLSANNSINTSKYSADMVKNFASGTINLMQGINSVYNGYISEGQYDMKAANKEFQAEQNERAARLLRQNMRDINRAAQADANVYRLEGVKTKSAQRVGQAASGFAVGKGTYKVMLDTTDARTNYNASMIMLKAGLQNAEVLRQAGTLEAQAILDRFDAEALRKQGDFEKSQGWMTGVMKAIEAGVDFYVGTQGFGKSDKKSKYQTGAKYGQAATMGVNGVAMYGSSI